jgi:type II secretory pathway pseudopilin PulG
MDLRMNRRRSKQRGVSMIELLVVVFILMITASMSSPFILRTIYDLRLRGSAGDLAGLFQQARIMAGKDNQIYPVRYANQNGANLAYIDLNRSGVFNPAGGAAEPNVQLSGTVTIASGAPTGTGSQPAPYVLAGDTGTGSPFTNGTILGFSPRALPCDYSSPPTCSIPARNYFVYYLTDTRFGSAGWAAVAVTKAGRTKVVVWDGTSWH